ncbi:hypothetical protein AVEN_93548-1 [Araneus ventricosus]|uniref:Uncharacterized protein n=1 Tax=Araneus ventricosus TaxID=182803 RepID=A0A4Y2AS31_ARAVE|nr:hypothetical protein AVEN_93548-1 [Araneus ventricosus]
MASGVALGKEYDFLIPVVISGLTSVNPRVWSYFYSPSSYFALKRQKRSNVLTPLSHRKLSPMASIHPSPPPSSYATELILVYPACSVPRVLKRDVQHYATGGQTPSSMQETDKNRCRLR